MRPLHRVCASVAACSLMLCSCVWASSISIPLNNKAQWIELAFASIAANTVSYTNHGLTIAVDDSASPLIHPLSQVVKVNRVRVQGTVAGGLNLPMPESQGQKGFDDYRFRLGLVEAGSKTLSIWQKPFAAKWIKQLFALAPEGSGVNKIEFFNVPEAASMTGNKRAHPASDLLIETVLDPADAQGNINIDLALSTPITTLALWISSDGDDTQSQYTINISKIELFTDP